MKSGYIEFLHLSTYHCKNLATCCLGAYRTESRDLVIGKSAGVDLLLCFFSTTTCMRVVITLCNSITICKDVCSCCHLASYLHNHAIYACEHANMQHSFFQIYSFTSNIVSVGAGIGYHAPRVTNHALFFARAITQQTLSKKRVQDANQRLFMQSKYLSFENFLQNLLLIHCQHFLADK